MEFLLNHWYYVFGVFLITPAISLVFLPFLIRTPILYFRWLICAPFALTLYVLSYLLAPLLSAISVLCKISVLPWPLNYFHTHDDDLDGGQHQLGWPIETGFKLWLQRMLWICRNPAYGFDAFVFGIKGNVFTKIYTKYIGDWENSFFNIKYETLKSDIGSKSFSFKCKIITGNKESNFWIGWTLNVVDQHLKFKNSINFFRDVE